MKPKRKPNKETLDQYIFDMGFEEAINFFGITERQAENILFNKVIDRKKATKPEIESILEIFVDIDFEKAFPVLMVLRDNYRELKKQYVWNTDTKKINVRSETIEDKFHNAIIRIIENLSQFTYKDDTTTLAYVKSRLFFEDKRDKEVDHRLSKKTQFLHNCRSAEYVEQLLNNLTYEEVL